MNRQEYVNAGIKICEELVRKYPVETVGSSVEGRRNAQKVQDVWLAKVEAGGNFMFEGYEVKIDLPEEGSGQERTWIDFSFTYKEEYFPVNFKSGKGKTADNVSGLKYLNYLLFNEEKGSTEKTISQKIVKLLLGNLTLNTTQRDYFLIAHNIQTGEVHAVPFLCVDPAHIVTNPKNLFQVNFHTASFDKTRSFEDCIRNLICKYVEYQKKRAEGYVEFENADLLDEENIQLPE